MKSQVMVLTNHFYFKYLPHFTNYYIIYLFSFKNRLFKLKIFMSLLCSQATLVGPISNVGTMKQEQPKDLSLNPAMI